LRRQSFCEFFVRKKLGRRVVTSRRSLRGMETGTGAHCTLNTEQPVLCTANALHTHVTARAPTLHIPLPQMDPRAPANKTATNTPTDTERTRL
jgi:hypothetical protein